MATNATNAACQPVKVSIREHCPDCQGRGWRTVESPRPRTKAQRPYRKVECTRCDRGWVVNTYNLDDMVARILDELQALNDRIDRIDRIDRLDRAGKGEGEW